MTRTSLMINRDMANALADDAQRQGKPLFYLANDIVKLYLKAREKGYDLDEMMDSYEVYVLARRMGHILVSDDLFESLVEKAAAGKPKKLVPLSKESGRKMGRYADIIFPDPVEGLKRILPNLFWGISFDVKASPVGGTLCVTAPRRSQGRVHMIASFIEGFMDAYNYSLEKTEVMTGLIKIEFSKRSL